MSELSQSTERCSSIKFILNDQDIELELFSPDALLLDFIREEKRLTGTKEGCGEGDCGACTVLVGRLRNGQLEYKSVNACIQFLASLDAKHIVTIEALADGALKPLQDAMIQHHGSQCGFCTPGIMMSLFALLMGNAHPTTEEIEIALQGNLCRCTGYEPIVKAALYLVRDKTCVEWLEQQRAKITHQLQSICHKNCVEIAFEDKTALIPKTVHDLVECLNQHQDATLIAGATDVGLWVTKQFRHISPAIFMADVAELDVVTHSNGLMIGANVTYANALNSLTEYHAAFETLLHRIGGAQVRNAGTIGGNIANGSPIGDMPPALIALGTTLNLRSVEGARQIPLEDFFIDYGKQDRRLNEFVEYINLPLLKSSEYIQFYKISKRRDEDISSVMAAFKFEMDADLIKDARIAFGGMAGTPKRATHSEEFLIEKPLNETIMQEASQLLVEDFTPLSDWRASAGYRMSVAQNLFVKCAIDFEAGGVSNAA